MRALWSRDDASYHGKFVAFDGMSCNPKPANGSVPIVIGGHSEAAARRAGRLGNGFFPATGAPVNIAPLIEVMRKTADEHGRDANAIEITTGCPDALPGSGVDPVKAVLDAASKGAGRIALPVTAFMSGAAPPAGKPGVQHAQTFGGLSSHELEDRLMAFGEQVIRKVNG
jgi:alkanesulfonate monooxygenase SsuD/methylene tetrahydromethanopterin reductase-like flavin-dependent oxidoreductase (luciferase family)